MSRAWLVAAFAAVSFGVFLDVWTDWFPGFLAGLLLGITFERFEKRRRTHETAPRQPEG